MPSKEFDELIEALGHETWYTIRIAKEKTYFNDKGYSVTILGSWFKANGRGRPLKKSLKML